MNPFEVGDIVTWRRPNSNRPGLRLGHGPFEITTLCDRNGHIRIKPLPGTEFGDFTEDISRGGEITCRHDDLAPAEFLTAARKAIECSK